MKGDKITFIKDRIFYKEYSKNEFMFLKMLHGETGLNIDLEMIEGKQFISMPEGNVISIDTITATKRNSPSLQNIIIKNLPFMLKQVSLLNNLGIYYSDCMQWLYHDNRLYLIDMDAAYFTKIDYNYNNYDLLVNFLTVFNIDSSSITESLRYLDLFRQTDIEWTFYKQEEKELYKKLNNPSMKKNHVYHCRNTRHIQVNIEHIHVYGNSGNMIITEHILNPEIVNEWELTRIA